MSYGITDFTAFLIGTIVIVLLPGPNSLYVMSLASRHGIATGYRGAAGIVLGDTVLMILSVSGVASLLKSWPALFLLLKVVGAAYLGWLGWKLLRAGLSRRATPDLPAATSDSGRPLRTAMLISLTNPKAILFFVSFFIQFVSPETPNPLLAFLILGVVVQICSLLYLSALIFGGAHLARHFRQHPGLGALASALVGLMFLGFALRLGMANLA